LAVVATKRPHSRLERLGFGIRAWPINKSSPPWVNQHYLFSRSFASTTVEATQKKVSELKNTKDSPKSKTDFRAKRQARSKRQAKRHNFELAPIEVAVVGRPNVGKSTLFNRLIRKKEAIVSNVAGTTRDRKEGKGHIGEINFNLIDTGGFEDIIHGKKSPTELLAPEHGTSLVEAMHHQVQQAIQNAHVVLFLVDAREGVTNMDVDLARWVRRNRGPGFFDEATIKRITTRIETDYGVDDIWGKQGIVLIANKSEGKGDAFEWGNLDEVWANFIQECYKLGFGAPLPMSAEHNQGLGELHNALLPFAVAQAEQEKRLVENEPKELDPTAESNAEETDEENTDENAGKIVITFVGRPNVGKSTLMNAIVGEQRCITGPVPGLTRDAIQMEWEHDNRKMCLIDTAGIRRRTKLFGGVSSAGASASAAGLHMRDYERSAVAARKNDAALEDLSIQRSLRSLDKSHVVMVVVDAMAQQADPDASGPLTKHDLSIIGRVLDEGRALVVVANKCDLADEDWESSYKSNIEEYIRYYIEDAIPMAKGVPIIPMSALTSQGIKELLPTVVDTFDRWRSRIPTRKLNLWLQDAQARQPPPPSAGAVYRGKQTVSGPLRIKYATQPSSRPPTFVLFVNRFNPKPDLIPEDYQRFLVNNLRSSFNLQGIPLRFAIKGSTSKERLRSPLKRPQAKTPRLSPRRRDGRR